MENPVFAYSPNAFLSTGNFIDLITYPQGTLDNFFCPVIHKLSFHIPQPLVENLKQTVDICRDVANIVLQHHIVLVQFVFHLGDGVQNRGVIAGKFLSDMG